MKITEIAIIASAAASVFTALKPQPPEPSIFQNCDGEWHFYPNNTHE